MRIIISKQKKFFTSQGKKINTLKISDIANELNLSSSTVSRAVKEKYIKTDFGIISLRKLFNLDSAVFLDESFSNLRVFNGFPEKYHNDSTLDTIDGTRSYLKGKFVNDILEDVLSVF